MIMHVLLSFFLDNMENVQIKELTWGNVVFAIMKLAGNYIECKYFVIR